MKFKIFPVLAATLMLASCTSGGGNEPTPPTPGPDPEPQESWTYLNFLSNSTVRFDLFDIEEGLILSYGNATLDKAINNLTLNDNSKVTINKNTTNDKSFNAIWVAEDGKGNVSLITNPGIEGDNITSFLEIAKSRLVGYKRAYVAFSMGGTAKWTTGLNAQLDSDIEARINIK